MEKDEITCLDDTPHTQDDDTGIQLEDREVLVPSRWLFSIPAEVLGEICALLRLAEVQRLLSLVWKERLPADAEVVVWLRLRTPLVRQAAASLVFRLVRHRLQETTDSLDEARAWAHEEAKRQGFSSAIEVRRELLREHVRLIVIPKLIAELGLFTRNEVWSFPLPLFFASSVPKAEPSFFEKLFVFPSSSSRHTFNWPADEVVIRRWRSPNANVDRLLPRRFMGFKLEKGDDVPLAAALPSSPVLSSPTWLTELIFGKMFD